MHFDSLCIFTPQARLSGRLMGWITEKTILRQWHLPTRFDLVEVRASSLGPIAHRYKKGYQACKSKYGPHSGLHVMSHEGTFAATIRVLLGDDSEAVLAELRENWPGSLTSSGRPLTERKQSRKFFALIQMLSCWTSPCPS